MSKKTNKRLTKKEALALCEKAGFTKSAKCFNPHSQNAFENETLFFKKDFLINVDCVLSQPSNFIIWRSDTGFFCYLVKSSPIIAKTVQYVCKNPSVCLLRSKNKEKDCCHQECEHRVIKTTTDTYEMPREYNKLQIEKEIDDKTEIIADTEKLKQEITILSEANLNVNTINKELNNKIGILEFTTQDHIKEKQILEEKITLLQKEKASIYRDLVKAKEDIAILLRIIAKYI
jgi:hypothetical protein